MYNLRNELIKSAFGSLKIDNNPFNMATALDAIEPIPDEALQSFYKDLFGTNHAFLNGMDRLIKVAEVFAPATDTGVKDRAKRLVRLMEDTNTAIGEEAKAQSKDFVKLVKYGIELTLPKDDVAILDLVKPYSNHKDLIINIRHYQTSTDSLTAFVNAINYFDRISGTEAIENKSIKRLKNG